jgi:hypothetical protein
MLGLFVQYLPDLTHYVATSVGLVEEDNGLSVWGLADTVTGFLLTAFVQAGMTRIYVKVARSEEISISDMLPPGPYRFGSITQEHANAARAEEPSISDVLSGGRYFLPILGLTLLSNVAIGLGIVALIVPGIVIALGFQLANFFVVDAEMGPVASMTASWHVTKGHRLALFGFNIAAVLLVLVGALALGVGAIVAISVTGIAEAIIYLRISGRAGPPPEQAMVA